MTERRRISVGSVMLIVLAVLFIYYLFNNMGSGKDVTYGELRQLFEQEKVQSFTFEKDRLVATLDDKSTVSCDLYSVELFREDLNELVVAQYEAGIITGYDYPDSTTTNWLQLLLPYVLAFLAFILLMNMMSRMMGGGGAQDKMARFGEARTKVLSDDGKKVTFRDVAGADEEKEELREIVEFLREPEKYIELGAHIPKGVTDIFYYFSVLIIKWSCVIHHKDYQVGLIKGLLAFFNTYFFDYIICMTDACSICQLYRNISDCKSFFYSVTGSSRNFRNYRPGFFEKCVHE